MATNVSKYFSKLSQKRKPSSTSSAESDVSPLTKQDKKRPFHQLSDSFNDSEDVVEEDKMTILETLDEIKKQFETLATKSDIRQLKSDLDKLTTRVTERMDRLEESRCFDIENELDNVKKDMFSVRKENADLKDQMRQQDQRMQRVRSDLNDQEQYDRRWNLSLQRQGADFFVCFIA